MSTSTTRSGSAARSRASRATSRTSSRASSRTASPGSDSTAAAVARQLRAGASSLHVRSSTKESHMKVMTSDNMKEVLQPAVLDAARSLEYGLDGISEEAAAAWFDGVSIEDLQYHVMSAIQEGVLAAMGLRRTADG